MSILIGRSFAQLRYIALVKGAVYPKEKSVVLRESFLSSMLFRKIFF